MYIKICTFRCRENDERIIIMLVDHPGASYPCVALNMSLHVRSLPRATFKQKLVSKSSQNGLQSVKQRNEPRKTPQRLLGAQKN